MENTPAAPPKDLYLYAGGADGDTYTASDDTYSRGSILVGIAPDNTISAATLNIVSGGDVESANVNGNSGINVTGGRVDEIMMFDDSTANISGGNIGIVIGVENNAVNISGGVVAYAIAAKNSTFTVSGATLPTGIRVVNPTVRVVFVGVNVVATYVSDGNNDPHKVYADVFTITGIFNNVADVVCDLYIVNRTGVGNPTPRQFTIEKLPEI